MANFEDWKKYMSEFSDDNLHSLQVKDAPELLNPPTPINWSDDYFKANFVSNLYKMIRPNMQSLKNHAKVFLKFYYTGEVISHEDIARSILCLLYGLTLTDHNQPNDIYIIDSPNLIGNEKWVIPIDISKWIEKPLSPYWLAQEGILSTNQEIIVLSVCKYGREATITQFDIDTWAEFLWNGIDSAQSRDVIKYLGFLAGTICRLIAIEPASVEYQIIHFSMDQYFSIFRNELPVNFSAPPNTKVYDICNTALRKTFRQANKILATIVDAYINAPEPRRDVIQKALKAMCLMYFGSQGLETVNWAQKAAEASNVDLTTFLSRIAVEKYYVPCKQLYAFMKYQIEHKQKSSVYAHLFNEGAFTELSTKSHPDFVMVCAAISLDACENHKIWKTLQFQNYATKVSHAVEFAYIFKNHYHLKSCTITPMVSGPTLEFANSYEQLQIKYYQDRHKNAVKIQWEDNYRNNI